MRTDEKKLPDLRCQVYPDCGYADYHREGCLVIRGLTVRDCHFLANFLFTCWNHDHPTLCGILVGISPHNMNAYWDFGCNLHHGPPRPASVRRRKHRHAA